MQYSNLKDILVNFVLRTKEWVARVQVLFLQDYTSKLTIPGVVNSATTGTVALFKIIL